MRVLVDAHLLKRLSELLAAHEIESKHTLDLPKKNATPDSEIIRLADDENRVVISKDSDFLDNYILDGSPKKLLIVSTGYINNQNLIRLFRLHDLSSYQMICRAVIVVDQNEVIRRAH